MRGLRRFWKLPHYNAAVSDYGGPASIAVALLSPVDALASTRLSMHMVQHLLLLMIAPLSFLLANPLTPFLWGLPTALRRGLGKIVARGSLFRRLLWASTLMPVTWSLYVINFWAWHHPALYQAALNNEWIHDLQHLLFFFTAVLFWWPIVNLAEHASRHDDLDTGACHLSALRDGSLSASICSD